MKKKDLLWSIMFSCTMIFGFAAFAEAGFYGKSKHHEFTADFRISECTFSNIGTNPYFILQPGLELVLEGEEKKEAVRLEIRVLYETELVDGVQTRVVQERELVEDDLIESSRNYFVICNETNSVFYLGEDVDIFENGQVIHGGSWRAGVDGAEPGIIMPGTILLGARYFQEQAPGVAMDRAEIISINEAVQTPLDTFGGCLKTLETSAIEPNAKDSKFYAPGVGIIVDGPLSLTEINFF
jgi:hypothetical protein